LKITNSISSGAGTTGESLARGLARDDSELARTSSTVDMTINSLTEVPLHPRLTGSETVELLDLIPESLPEPGKTPALEQSSQPSNLLLDTAQEDSRELQLAMEGIGSGAEVFADGDDPHWAKRSLTA